MSAKFIPKEWPNIDRKASVEPKRRPILIPTTTTTTTRGVGRALKPVRLNRTIVLVNQTGTEFMQLHGSTVVMASDNAVVNPLTIVLVIMSIFLFMTLSVTVAIIVFCKKKNTVFVLQKCEQDDEVSYELDEMNNTDIEFADFKGEHEAMLGKPRKSATCPDLAECLDSDDPMSLHCLLDTESETEDNSCQQRSPVRPKLKRRSNSFTFQNADCYGYQQMIVTAVMEIGSANKIDENGANKFTASEYNTDSVENEDTSNKSIPNGPNIDRADPTREAIESQKPVRHKSIAHASTCFNDAKLAFLELDTEPESCSSHIGLPAAEIMENRALHGTSSEKGNMFFNEKTGQHRDKHSHKIFNESDLNQPNNFHPNKNVRQDKEINSNCSETLSYKLEPHASKSTDTSLMVYNDREVEIKETGQSNPTKQILTDQSNLRTEEVGQSLNQSQNCFQNSQIFPSFKTGSVKRKHYSIPTGVSNLTNETESNKRLDKTDDESETLLQTAVEMHSKDLDHVTDTTGLLQ